MKSAKTGWSQLKVGLLASAGLILLFALVFYITSSKSLFESTSDLVVYLDSSQGLQKSSPVRLNGLLAGKISKMELSGESKPGRIVKITMEIENRMLKEIPIDSKVSIGAESLLGSKLLAIKKGQSPTPVQANAELQSLSSPELEDIQQQASQTIAVLQNILTKAEGIVGQIEAGKGTIGKLLVDEELYNRFLNITKEIQKLSESLNSSQSTMGKLLNDDALYNDIRKSMGRLDTIIADIQAGQGTAGKLLKDTAVYDEARKSLAEMRIILADLNAGKGTAGKLLKDDALAQQLSATIARVDLTLDKINTGQGTLGQLLVNPSLYENLNGTAVEMKGLMKDFRANPKKFLRIKLALF
jgi:phospholipid/cholesterol/gamma-HCH transport system substrate-binding protein